MSMTRSEKRLTQQLFLEIIDGSMAQSRRELDRVAQQLAHKSTWHQGYINAIEGMVTAQETHDTMAYINLLSTQKDRAPVVATQKSFKADAVNGLHDAFSQGVFSAWADFLGVWLKRTQRQQRTLL